MRGCVTLAVLLASFGAAHARTVNLDTDANRYTKWTVYEHSGGVKVSGVPVYVGKYGWGHIPGITIPFTNCDGYWVAERKFRVPIGATNAVLTITGLSVDDRVVVELNGVAITAAGTTKAGQGEMQFRDPGKSKPYTFPYKAGPVSVTDSADLRPGGNKLAIIVNNTGDGIFGKIEPVTKDSPSNAGIRATLSYDDP
jgi:hypothetical protein